MSLYKRMQLRKKSVKRSNECKGQIADKNSKQKESPECIDISDDDGCSKDDGKILKSKKTRYGIINIDKDIRCLKPRKLINDAIIEFYLNYLNENILSSEERERTYIFSPFFYEDLRRPGKNRVEKWTKNVNIFEKDFLIVPINEDNHWFVVIICFPGLVSEIDHLALSNRKIKLGFKKKRKIKRYKLDIVKSPCILMFDSLVDQDDQSETIENLRDYLSYTHKQKSDIDKEFSENTIKTYKPEVPQQSNNTDCGLYVLQYVESFFQTVIKDSTFSVENLENWFDRKIISRKRGEISKLITEIWNETEPNNRNTDVADVKTKISVEEVDSTSARLFVMNV